MNETTSIKASHVFPAGTEDDRANGTVLDVALTADHKSSVPSWPGRLVSARAVGIPLLVTVYGSDMVLAITFPAILLSHPYFLRLTSTPEDLRITVTTDIADAKDPHLIKHSISTHLPHLDQPFWPLYRQQARRVDAFVQNLSLDMSGSGSSDILRDITQAGAYLCFLFPAVNALSMEDLWNDPYKVDGRQRVIAQFVRFSVLRFAELIEATVSGLRSMDHLVLPFSSVLDVIGASVVLYCELDYVKQRLVTGEIGCLSRDIVFAQSLRMWLKTLAEEVLVRLQTTCNSVREWSKTIPRPVKRARRTLRIETISFHVEDSPSILPDINYKTLSSTPEMTRSAPSASSSASALTPIAQPLPDIDNSNHVFNLHKDASVYHALLLPIMPRNARSNGNAKVGFATWTTPASDRPASTNTLCKSGYAKEHFYQPFDLEDVTPMDFLPDDPSRINEDDILNTSYHTEKDLGMSGSTSFATEATANCPLTKNSPSGPTQKHPHSWTPFHVPSSSSSPNRIDDEVSSGTMVSQPAWSQFGDWDMTMHSLR